MEDIKIENPEETTVENAPEQKVTVVEIQFRPGQKVYYFDPNGLELSAGEAVIIDTARGPEFGTCASGNRTIPAKEIVSPLRSVLRRATEHDLRIVSENRKKEKQAYDACLKRIGDMGLDMQLVSAECAFDGSKILFFFTADERVDFRELVKNLASQFHTRIELRQIGVRDKAKMVGGLGICGRPFCCASFLDDFQPVSIKMAKTQNLSLNPTKISGTCGRLMCCLKYEQDAYEDLIKNSPKLESFVDTPDGRGTVVELDLLRQRVKVRFEERPETVGTFANSEIAVLRNGKAKKTDPPIPADLAPISGAGARRRLQREQDLEKAPALESIKFRYSTEEVAAEQPVKPEKTEHSEKAEKESKNRRRRGNRKPTEQAAKPQEQKQEKKQEKPNAPKQEKAQEGKEQEQAAQGAKKPNRRRNFHHRRRPGSKPQEGSGQS